MGFTIPESIRDIVVAFSAIHAMIIFKVYNAIVMNSLFGWQRGDDDHASRVAGIQAEIQKWNTLQNGKKMCTARPTWKSISPTKSDKSSFHPIPYNLNKIVKIDEINKEITVEPDLMIGQLTRIIVPMGWTLPVVPELDTLTIGGLVAGLGIESSSHRHGLFSDSVLSYEIVLPCGSVMVCSKEENQDLYYTIPGSLGTLGFITAVKFPLIAAQPYIKIKYHYCDNPKAVETLITGTGKECNFIESFAFSPTDFIVMLSDFSADKEPIPTNKINRFYKPFFHNQAKKVMERLKNEGGRATHEELIPTLDYYHRHTRGVFWMAEKVYSFIRYDSLFWIYGCFLPFPVHGQALAPWVISYTKRKAVLQDYLIPIQNLEKFFAQGCKDFQIYPVWMCPANLSNTSTNIKVKDEGKLFIDLGWYGVPPKETKKSDLLKKYEQYVIENDGFQLLYAESYLTEAQVAEMFDLTLYTKMRDKTGASNALPTMYEKIASRVKKEEVDE